MTSQLKHCDDGPTPEELLLLGHLVENDSIQLKESLEITNRHSSRKDLLCQNQFGTSAKRP